MEKTRDTSVAVKIVLGIIAGSFVLSSLSQRSSRNAPFLIVDETPVFYTSDLRKFLLMASVDHPDDGLDSRSRYLRIYRRAVSRMTSLAVMEQIAQDLGLNISAEDVRHHITTRAQFLASEVFDPQKLQDHLTTYGISEIDYMRFMKAKLLRRQIKQPLKQLFALNPYVQQKIATGHHQKFSGRFWTLDVDDLALDPVNNPKDRAEYLIWMHQQAIHPQTTLSHNVDIWVWRPDPQTCEPRPEDLQASFLQAYPQGGIMSEEIRNQLRATWYSKTHTEIQRKLAHQIPAGTQTLSAQQIQDLTQRGGVCYPGVEIVDNIRDTFEDISGVWNPQKIAPHLQDLEHQPGFSAWRNDADVMWCARWNHKSTQRALTEDELVVHRPSVDAWRQTVQEKRLHQQVFAAQDVLMGQTGTSFDHRSWQDLADDAAHSVEARLLFTALKKVQATPQPHTQESARNTMVSVTRLPSNRTFFALKITPEAPDTGASVLSETAHLRLSRDLWKMFWQGYLKSEAKRRLIQVHGDS